MIAKIWILLQESPAKSIKYLSKGKRYFAIEIITTTFLDSYIVKGTIDGEFLIN